LDDSSNFALHRASSLQDLKHQMADDPRGDLGLALPANLDARLASDTSQAGDVPAVSGYVMWSSRSKGTALASDLERQIEDLIGYPIQIIIQESVYPGPDSMRSLRMIAVTLVLTIILIVTLTVPHLMFEEKQTKTIDALLVSPATIGQVVMGKALAGLFYCSAAIVAILIFSWAFVVNWALAAVAVLSCTLLAIGLGLLLGTLFENRQQMMTSALIAGQFLLGPVFLTAIDPILPETLRIALYWIPTASLTLLFRYAFSSGATAAQILSHFLVVLATIALIFGFVVWKIRRAKR
jgi:ABC-2 type transport system permease protein